MGVVQGRAPDCQLRECSVDRRVVRIGTLGDTKEYICIHQTRVDHHLFVVLIKAFAGEGFFGKLWNLVGELRQGIKPGTNFF
jgi:hypothetical protein